MIGIDMKSIELENNNTKSFFNDRYVWILLIISLSVRIYLSFFTYVIRNDSVAFIQNARYFAGGDFLSGLRHDYHPLYSFFMAVMYKVIPDMEISGTIVSVSFGTLTVIVFYLIGKSVFDRKISFVSSVILALHPYAVRFSVDIISESTYFFFFISALGLGFFAIVKRKYYLFALTGISSAFAYLARPEGIGIIFIVAGWYILKDCVRIKAVWKEKLVSILILTASFIIISMPYLVFIKKDTGYWHLTKKKNITQVVGVDAVLSSGGSKQSNDLKKVTGNSHLKEKKDVFPVVGVDAALNSQDSNELSNEDSDKKKSPSGVVAKQKTTTRQSGIKLHLNGILHVIKRYLSTFHYFLFVFLMIGVLSWTRMKTRRLFGLYIATAIASYLFILYRLCMTYYAIHAYVFQYPSRRHLVPLVIPAIFCVGMGAYATGSWIHKRFKFERLKNGLRGRLRDVWIVQLVILMIIISVLLPKTLKSQRYDKLGIKEVGQWVRKHTNKQSPVILSTSARNAYYAGGKHVQMYGINDALAVAQAKKADYIIIMQRDYEVIEQELLQHVKDKKIALAYKFPGRNSLNKRSMLLYKVMH
jgi:4-amino-4-deoxy-L-arabinose transferase-like glycosyltransferase